MMKTFRYTIGEEVLLGDRIEVAGKPGTIEGIFGPETQEAAAYFCRETGGLLIEFDDGDLQVWLDANEDLIFVRRGTLPRKTPGA